jgi:hypothetical protein
MRRLAIDGLHDTDLGIALGDIVLVDAEGSDP